jgi:hypothetical protein
MRSKPSDGKMLRLKRVLAGKYAVSIQDIARYLRVGERQAYRYLEPLIEEGHVYLRYRQRCHYYSLRRKI